MYLIERVYTNFAERVMDKQKMLYTRENELLLFMLRQVSHKRLVGSHQGEKYVYAVFDPVYSRTSPMWVDLGYWLEILQDKENAALSISHQHLMAHLDCC